ncbi:MAG TPA: hypothetical protein VFS20_26830 [Longimicrobium sp.]|nr:hypothetical protein [Longimicrobium sp.]
MAKLTRKQRRLLEFTGNLARMYIALATVAFALWALSNAQHQYRQLEILGLEPDIPRAATYGTIAGIYMPLFAAAAAYIWATRAFPEREVAPHGFAMALFRDLFTLLVISVLLYLPVGLYGSHQRIQTVNTLLVWYQTVITAGAGGAFAYYFHASLSPGAGKRGPAATPRKPRAHPAPPAAVRAGDDDRPSA